MEKMRAKVEFKQIGMVEVNHATSEFRFQVDIKNVGMTDMKDFTIMSAQASEEATFDEPNIVQGYGFSFFGAKGYTFSPIFARDHIVVEFRGRFVSDIPLDKFTVVLKRIKGEEAVPLFQTLTFRMAQIEKFEDLFQQHRNEVGEDSVPTGDPCDSAALVNNQGIAEIDES